MLKNSKGQILLQKRASAKKSYPNCWDNSAAGYVDAGESYMEAAKRELYEELGIINLDLEELGYYFAESCDGNYKFKRFNKVYKVYSDGTPTKIQKSELSNVRWFSITEAKKLITQNPDKVSDGLAQVIKRYY